MKWQHINLNQDFNSYPWSTYVVANGRIVSLIPWPAEISLSLLVRVNII